MLEIVLPRLVSSRAAARALVEKAGAIQGERVIINCRDLRSATPSFVDELVKRVLGVGNASEMIVEGADQDFRRYLEDSANAHGVAKQVSVLPAGEELQVH